MSSVYLYTFEDDRGVPQDFSTFSVIEAREYARANRFRCHRNEYAYEDRTVHCDYTRSTGRGDGDAADVYEADDAGMVIAAYRGDERIEVAHG